MGWYQLGRLGLGLFGPTKMTQAKQQNKITIIGRNKTKIDEEKWNMDVYGTKVKQRKQSYETTFNNER